MGIGASFQYMSPTGEFRQNVGDAPRQHRGAFGVNLIGPLTHPGWLSMRFEYMFGSYDKSCYTCRRGFNSVSVGPEIWFPYGPVRPYAMGAGGHFHFEGFKDASGGDPDTGAGQWIYGGGVRIPLKSDSGYSLDLGVRRHQVGKVSYLRKAGIQTNADGSVSVDSARGSVSFVLYTIGFQYQFK